MSLRDRILGKVRKATDAIPDKTSLPTVEEIDALKSRLVPDSDDLDTLVAAFRDRWAEVHGILVESRAELDAFLAVEGVARGYADPSLASELGLNDLVGLQSEFTRAEVDEIEYGITRADLGIAETGTIALSDKNTANRLAALAPWIHVAVLRKVDIVSSLAKALKAAGRDPSIVLVTGPSKTADIEGILIEGVHGPGKQVCWLV